MQPLISVLSMSGEVEDRLNINLLRAAEESRIHHPRTLYMPVKRQFSIRHRVVTSLHARSRSGELALLKWTSMNLPS